MAIYHLSIKIASRGKGKSAVAAAAYRAGEILINKYDGRKHDYSRRHGIEYAEILLPEHAPKEYFDRSVLWNAVEKIEKSKNSQLTREFEIALPVELTREQNINLVLEYVKENFVDKGICADICIHDTGDGNPHAHILTTMRPINIDGTWGTRHRKEYILDKNGNKMYDPVKKTYKCKRVSTTDWDDRTKAEYWRKQWADSLNRYLKMYNKDVQVDHRSYLRQGKEQIPTIHLGSAAWRMEKRGIQTARGNINRDIEVTNNRLRQLNARFRKVSEQLYSIVLENPPTVLEVLKNVEHWKTLDTQWQKIQHLKETADMYIFLREYGASNMAEVALVAKELHMESLEVTKQVKNIDKRLDTLGKHLAHAEVVSENYHIIKRLDSLPEHKKAAYVEKHKNELVAYKKSNDYLTGVLNGRDKIPVKAWKKEIEKLTDERYVYGERYYALYKEINIVEKIRNRAEGIIEETTPIARRAEPVKPVIAKKPKPVLKSVKNTPVQKPVPEKKRTQNPALKKETLKNPAPKKTAVQKPPVQKPGIRAALTEAKKESREYLLSQENYRNLKKYKVFDR